MQNENSYESLSKPFTQFDHYDNGSIKIHLSSCNDTEVIEEFESVQFVQLRSSSFLLLSVYV